MRTRNLFFFLIIFGVSAAKAGIHFPTKCISQGFKFQSQQLILHEARNDEPELYLFYNQSKIPLLLTHPQERGGASAGWDSLLNPGKVSAFLVNRPDFAVSCGRWRKNSATTPDDCARVLMACRYSTITITQQQMIGTFWVGENKPLNELLAIITQRGITN